MYRFTDKCMNNYGYIESLIFMVELSNNANYMKIFIFRRQSEYVGSMILVHLEEG